MEETMNAGQEQEQTSDAFLEGLENGQSSDTADQPIRETAGEEQAEDPDAAEGDAGTEGRDSVSDAPADTRQEGEEDKTGPEEEKEKAEEPNRTAWSVKHMGAQRTITAAEITPELLQKGLDYDRVRERYNEAKPIMEMFGQFAQKADMSVAEYVRHLRAEAKRSGGMSPAEARRAVEMEDREAAALVQENYRREKAARNAKGLERIQADLADFSKVFPEIYRRVRSEPGLIPRQVWDEVTGGMSLTAAYSRYTINAANEQLRAAREGARVNGENRRNAQRSTGSMRSAGSDIRSSDPFLEGFGG